MAARFPMMVAGFVVPERWGRLLVCFGTPTDGTHKSQRELRASDAKNPQCQEHQAATPL